MPNSVLSPKLSHYETLHKIRTFENLLLSYFSKGLIRGTTHTYLGQEAIAVSALSFLKDKDLVISNHRSHGHFISYCKDYKKLLEEIKGSDQGVCSGLGGSQHLYFKNFYSNGILGGTVPVATGMALAEKFKGKDSIAICFLGDGTMGEGIIYESFNMASLWSIPILYIIENNRFAQSTRIENNLAGEISNRIKAFDIETHEIESNDIGILLHHFKDAFDFVRSKDQPFCQIINTYRFGPHSKGDDFRSEDEIEEWKNKDPLILAKKYFQSEDIEKIEVTQEQEIKKSFKASFLCDRKNLVQMKNFDLETDRELIPKVYDKDCGWVSDQGEILMANQLNQVLQNLMGKNEKVYVMGEDLMDPYGGAFKITKGLSTKFPSRVLSTPVSEAGIVGLANGMALRGMIPIVEIMFGDFTTIIMDQVVNQATKFKRMYGGRVACPIIIRTPMGGYRGYGPTHSQCLEKLFFGVPGLVVTANDPVHDQNLIWDRMVKLNNPCLYVENKTLYAQKIKPVIQSKIDGYFVKSSESYFPTISLKITPFSEGEELLIFTYGGMVPMAMEVAKKLYVEEEIVAKVIIPSQISPLPEEDLLESVNYCENMIVLEEGTQRNGWWTGIAALFCEKINGNINFNHCSAKDTIIPNSKNGEDYVLPNEESCMLIIEEILDVI